MYMYVYIIGIKLPKLNPDLLETLAVITIIAMIIISYEQ